LLVRSCVQARSQEARANWETALDTKDRAITQLEEALESSKRALVRHSSSEQSAAAKAASSAGSICSIGSLPDNNAATAHYPYLVQHGGVYYDAALLMSWKRCLGTFTLLAQEAAHRQAAAMQDDTGATMSVVQGKVQALEAALAEAHATVSDSTCCPSPLATMRQQQLARLIASLQAVSPGRPSQRSADNFNPVSRVLLSILVQITQQPEAMSDQARQLEAARHATSQEGAAADARVRALQQGVCSAAMTRRCHDMLSLLTSLASVKASPHGQVVSCVLFCINLEMLCTTLAAALTLRCATQNVSAAELASCQVQQGQLQRELNQLRAMTAEKDERLADAAGGERQLRQQIEQLRQQLREAGAAHGRQLQPCGSTHTCSSVCLAIACQHGMAHG
jgi:hypothetical protein